MHRPPSLPAGSGGGTRDDEALAFVLTEAGVAGLCVVAANAVARRAGVAPGLRFADARARVPDIVAEPVDRAADTQALAALALWMERWSPAIALAGPDAVLIDATGCAHLFGGEAGMLDDIAAMMARAGLTCRLAMAPTPGAAIALARHAQDRTRLDMAGLAGGLSGLPVAGLRLSDAALTLLRRFGLTRIGQLYGIDRKALARRFHARAACDAVLLRLDQALGQRPEPLDPLRPPPDHAVRLPCPEPLLHADGIRAGLDLLVPALCERLDTHGEGARRFRLALFRSDQSVRDVVVGAARAVRDPDHVRRLFRDRLDGLDPGFGIELIELEASRTGPVRAVARDLGPDFRGETLDEGALSILADRITARLGDRVVKILRPVESHAPERAEAMAVYDGTLPDWGGAPACVSRAPRPVRLFDCPERLDVIAQLPDGPPAHFVWRRMAHRVVRADGPERIAPEWWRPPPRPGRARDYYRVEDEAGRRYWIFRDGLYDDGRGGPPAWFVHGLFP